MTFSENGRVEYKKVIATLEIEAVDVDRNMYKIPEPMVIEYDRLFSELIESGQITLTEEQLSIVRQNLEEYKFILPEGFENLSQNFEWKGVSIKEETSPQSLYRNTILQQNFNSNGDIINSDFVAVDLLNPSSPVNMLSKQYNSEGADGKLEEAEYQISHKPHVFMIMRLVRKFERKGVEIAQETNSFTAYGYIKFRIYNPENTDYLTKDKEFVYN